MRTGAFDSVRGARGPISPFTLLPQHQIDPSSVRAPRISLEGVL